MRRARILQQGAIYHIVAKTNRGEFILDSVEMKEMFLDILEAAKKKFHFKLKHFCIMSNHVHLLLQPAPETSLSKLMQWILSVFAIRFNKRYGLLGHVWYDRFKSTIIQTIKQFINTFQYISDNPIKAGICLNAGDYAFSGLNEIQREQFHFLDPPSQWMKLL